MIKAYYRLSKPGIVYGNLLTTIAAFLYASRWGLVSWDAWIVFLATVFGLGLVIASACVFNNFIDRDIDRKMKRTKNRALATGELSNENALLFATIIGLIGLTLLIAFVNLLSAFIAFVGFAVYVFAYTLLKRTTAWATEIGSISGAVPILVGYTAVTNRFDLVALMLFAIMIFWQMPHFFAIALFRFDDYAAANIPTLPLKKGARVTNIRALIYIVLFAIGVLALTVLGYAGYWYLVVVEIAAVVWFWRGTQGFAAVHTEAWARKFFFTSLVVLLVFAAMLSIANLVF
ncbi:MAG: heme o synthase [Candidatus Pacebacteria bacterium]|nr:heme o synthase [Candidatus Paceibacterota bacterium]